jgi:hypothetical protein
MPAVGVDVAGLADVDEVTSPGRCASPSVEDGTEGIIGARDDKTWKRKPRKRKRVKSFGG